MTLLNLKCFANLFFELHYVKLFHENKEHKHIRMMKFDKYFVFKDNEKSKIEKL